MTKTATITARVDAETLALVDQVAKAKGRSRSWLAEQAIRHVAKQEADFLAFVQAGIDSADRGELIPHDEVIAELDGMIDRHRARCRN
jgi:predicted transcriptional regulator